MTLFLFSRGAWRIRTAVDGFADRRLSHSSKAPSKRVKSDACISSFEREMTRPKVKAPFLNAGAKVVIKIDTAKFFGYFL